MCQMMSLGTGPRSILNTQCTQCQQASAINENVQIDVSAVTATKCNKRKRPKLLACQPSQFNHAIFIYINLEKKFHFTEMFHR